MKLKSVALGAIFAGLLASSAFAATVTAKYKATSAVGSRADHSLWISTGLGNGVGKDFNFTPFGTMTFLSDGTATLVGDVVSQTNALAGFKLSYFYDSTFKDINGNAFTPTFKSENGSKATASTFYRNLVGGVLRGTGILAGLDLRVTRKPVNGPWATQIGGSNGTDNGANNKNKNFGLANWFMINVTSATCSICSNNSTIANLNGKQGDINIDLTPVPVPGAGFLMVGGLSAFAALRRKRRKS
ncbi:MAG: VPLPA-CTERM sorting domain-containing protein [Paracoccaceae bacterium]